MAAMIRFPGRRGLALVVFALLIVAAPLLFGAVDRIVQIGLAGLLTLGLLLVPPELPKLEARTGWFLLGLGLLLLLKELLPATLFGIPAWRISLTENLKLPLPWTHNPEPARVLDIALMLVIGGAWFAWVRTLASRNEDRVKLAWTLFAAATVLALVCFAMGGAEDQPIYGLRVTPGWKGFGPFPNRNHTACFLAMGAMVGSGCIVHVLRRRRPVAALTGAAMLIVVVLALLASRSRGALLAAGAGLLVLSVLGLVRNPSRKSLAAVIAGGALAMAMLLALGARVRARFSGGAEGDLATNLRWDIWANTVRIWREAPIFGHGLGTFPQVFPLEQNLPITNMTVLHPESSWLQWLMELGALPVLLLAGALVVFVVKQQRQDWSTRSGFFLRAGALAGVVVLLVHGLWDVPAHRWGTAGFGLALLALACPLPAREQNLVPGPGLLLLPGAVAVFWALPIFLSSIPWSPLSLTQALAETRTPARRLRALLGPFPLSAPLHQLLGRHELALGHRESAWREFRIALRLQPSSFSLPLIQARAALPYSGGMALHFWSEAIARAGHRDDEFFQMAVRETAALPQAAAFWSGYADAHPAFLLSLAQVSDPETARASFAQWWKLRALGGGLDKFEIDNAYQLLARWGTAEQLRAWIAHHPERAKTDAAIWAKLLHRWHDDQLAWEMLELTIEEPEIGKLAESTPLPALEIRWRGEPGNARNAQTYAAALEAQGSTAEADTVMITAALAANPPDWLRRKGAFALARQQRWQEAVTLALGPADPP